MKLENVVHDLKSSVVVFLVALPLCLGIALASNAPMASGLIAGILGGIVIGFLSNSSISVSGPAAGLTVIVANGIAQLGGFEKFGVAVLIAGLIQLLFGVLRGGAIGDYFPTAVIKGMLAAIGLILIIKQLPNALGLPKGIYEVAAIDVGILIVSVISLFLMVIWEKMALKGLAFFKLVPGPLIAVIVSVVLNGVFGLVDENHLVRLPEKIFEGIGFPDFSALNFTVFQVALTIAVVASLETLLCIDAADKIDPEKRTTSKNRELLAQGIGNALSGLLGGLPLTAVIVRTSANVNAGAKSKLSAIFHGGWLVLCVFAIPGLLNMIPLATLACVLLLTGYKLTKPAYFVDMQKRGWDQLFIFALTIASILATDLLKGIFVGFVVALFFELRRPSISCVEIHHDENKVHVKFTNNVSFLHKAKILKLLNELPPGKSIHFHGLKMVRLHVDVHEMIVDYHENAKKNEVEVIFV